MLKRTIHAVLISIFLALSLQAAVTVNKQADGRLTLMVDGQPFFVKGVTFGINFDAESVDRYMKEVRDMGANCVRTWGCGEKDTPLILDSAQKYGIKVMLGLWMRYGRQSAEGYDNFNYVKDQAGKKAMYDDSIKWVKRFKDHPALLMWNVGNEVILNISTEPEKVAYAKLLEEIFKGIKAIDKNHPLTSSSAWSIDWPYWTKYCPSIDVYSVNSYGPGVSWLTNEWRVHAPKNKPWMITEFGARGEWDAPLDANGLKKEPTDTEKYEIIAKGFHDWIETPKSCAGGFVFNYGNGSDHGAVWLSMKVDGKFRPAYWATVKAFTGRDAPDAMPVISGFELPKDSGKPGEWRNVILKAADPEAKELDVAFYYNKREGSKKKQDAVVPLDTKGDIRNGFQIKVPQEKGAIKVYAYCTDKANNLSIAITSFVVNGKGDPSKNGLKVKLPFALYDEQWAGKDIPWICSGYMGDDVSAINVDIECRETPHTGKTCIKIEYFNTGGWGGLAWQDPANDWGDQPGGYDLSGATSMTFWARGKLGGETVKFGVGLIGKDKKYYDTAKAETGDVFLTTEWQKFTIDLAKKDLRDIKTGMTMFWGGQGRPMTVYLDDVIFE